MVKALKRKGPVLPKRKKGAVTLKAKPKISKKAERAKTRPAKSTDRIAGVEKSILSLRAILQGLRQRIAEIESPAIEPEASESKASESNTHPDEERFSNIENDISDLKARFDTRIDRAIIEIAERIEEHRRARIRGTRQAEPGSGPLASVIARFEETGVKGTWLDGSFGSNSR